MKYDKITKKEQTFAYTPATAELSKLLQEQFFVTPNVVNQRAVFIPEGRVPVEFLDWLQANAEHLGIQKIDDQGGGILVEFNKAGASHASYLFLVRSAWEYPLNTEAAIRRDVKEGLCG